MRKRVKRLHTDTLFSSAKITKSFYQELTILFVFFFQDCLLSCLLITCIHWKWQWLLAVIFLGEEHSPLSTLANIFEQLHKKAEEQRGAWAAPQDIAFQVLLLPQTPCVVFGKWLRAGFRQEYGHLCPDKARFPRLILCHHPNVPHAWWWRNPHASSSAAGPAMKHLSPV